MTAKRLEWSCDDRWTLGADDSVRFVVGDGAWYFNLEDCESAEARRAPSGCATALAGAVVAEQMGRDPLATAYKRQGSVTVLAVQDGASACVRWRFRRRGGKTHLTRRAAMKKGWSETSYGVRLLPGKIQLSGPSYRDSQGGSGGIGSLRAYPVEPVSERLVLVGGTPWFANERSCKRLARLATRPTAP